jgi:hypothetical protein
MCVYSPHQLVAFPSFYCFFAAYIHNLFQLLFFEGYLVISEIIGTRFKLSLLVLPVRSFHESLTLTYCLPFSSGCVRVCIVRFCSVRFFKFNFFLGVVFVLSFTHDFIALPVIRFLLLCSTTIYLFIYLLHSFTERVCAVLLYEHDFCTFPFRVWLG